MLLDGLFDIIDKIWQFKFFDSPYVDKVFSGAIIVACSWLVLKVILELVINHIIKNDGKGNPLTIYRGVVLAIVMMFLIPYLFQFGHNFSTKLTEAVKSVNVTESTNTSEISIANVIVSSVVSKDSTKEEDVLYISKNWKDVEINDTEINNDGIEVYKYSLNLFILIVLSFVVTFLFFFIAIQMAKRVIEISLYKIIGPFCCTSLTSNSRAFETWAKCTMGAFLVTVAQFVSIGLMFNLFGTAFTQPNVLVGLFLIIGALLFVINTPEIVSSLLSQQSGAMAGYGDMQSLVAMGTGLKGGLSVAGDAAKFGLSVASKVGGVAKNGANKIGGGISNMFRSSKGYFNEEQKQAVKDSMDRHNSSKAWRQTKDFTNQNTNRKSSSYNSNMNNGFNKSNNMKYNNMKNKYTNRNSFFTGGGK